MKLAKYTGYCTCFYVPEDKEVIFYDEIKDRPIKKHPVSGKEEADHVMKVWKDNAPNGIICDII